MKITPDTVLMQMAINEAKRGRSAGDYAIGALVVKDETIIVCDSNHAKIDQDSTQHAEMVVIREASKKLGSRFLQGCILYTTHEPCPMCASAAIWARMEGIVFGATLQDMINFRESNGTREWTWRTINITAAQVLEKGNPQLILVEGFMREECQKLFHSNSSAARDASI